MKTIKATAARLIGYATHGHGFEKTHYSLTRWRAKWLPGRWWSVRRRW